MGKIMAFSGQIQSVCQINERNEQAMADLSVQTLEDVWEILNFRINHIICVNGGHFEQCNIWVNLEYSNYNTD